MKEEKFVKKHKFEYLFGVRYMAFVQFPDTMTIRQIEEKLFWAKAYYPVSFDSKGIIIRCHVKTFEWKRFKSVNRNRLMEFKLDERIGSVVEVKTDENSTTLFEI